MKSRRSSLNIVLFCVLLGASSPWANNTHSLVLATSSQSELPPLTTQEARKLFLGVPLEKDGAHPIPLMNVTDPVLYQVFLQKVAYMSASNFENQTLSVVFRLGGKRPETYSDLNDLVSALQQHPGTVTYLWEDQVRANQGIKSLNVLWQDSPE